MIRRLVLPQRRPSDTNRLITSPPYAGREGPVPAPLLLTAAAISVRSLSSRTRSAAASQPSTCCGLRAPTIAPLTPGKARVQATATAPRLTPSRSATGRSPSNQGQVPGQAVAGEVAAAAAPVALVQVRRPLRGEGPGQQARAHRAVDDDPGAVRRAPRDQLGGRVPVNETELRLEGVHVRHRLGRGELGHGVVREPGGADLAFLAQVGEGLPVLLQRRPVLGGPVQLVEVDAVHAQAAQ